MDNETSITLGSAAQSSCPRVKVWKHEAASHHVCEGPKPHSVGPPLFSLRYKLCQIPIQVRARREKPRRHIHVHHQGCNRGHQCQVIHIWPDPCSTRQAECLNSSRARRTFDTKLFLPSSREYISSEGQSDREKARFQSKLAHVQQAKNDSTMTGIDWTTQGIYTTIFDA